MTSASWIQLGRMFNKDPKLYFVTIKFGKKFIHGLSKSSWLDISGMMILFIFIKKQTSSSVLYTNVKLFMQG